MLKFYGSFETETCFGSQFFENGLFFNILILIFLDFLKNGKRKDFNFPEKSQVELSLNPSNFQPWQQTFPTKRWIKSRFFVHSLYESMYEKAFSGKRLLNICVLLGMEFYWYWFFDWRRKRQIFPTSTAAAVLWYNGNFSRDFYGSDFASSFVYCSFFGSYISHELNKSERNKSSAQICKTVFITFRADIYTSECFLPSNSSHSFFDSVISTNLITVNEKSISDEGMRPYPLMS